MPTHSHTQTAQQPTFTYDRVNSYMGGGGNGAISNITASSQPNTLTTVGDATPGSTGNAGSSSAHTNMPPAYIGGITMIRAA